ncbi:hypothetical protein G7Y89_g13888 [Cudoniella acicularis]|uniref:Uncharacterized protein n=1 Tax=Cudoniella acicularis TaxID=354080 RepID=A0A8H4R7P4_9HELO|nr:hypothetical protein G7Y89_g13888 [Cudoniella acicularis]
MDENAPYWVAAFPAMSLIPLSADVLYTVSNLVISLSFPEDTQGLAGGVFNAIFQISKCVGLGITSIAASTVTNSKNDIKVEGKQALMSGYHASF